MYRSLIALLVLVTACGGGTPETRPSPSSASASPAQLDSMLTRAQGLLAEREWSDAAIAYERLLLELPRGDRRLAGARIALGEARLGLKSYLQAVREFRRTADEYPTDSLAPTGLLRAGDAYAELWRRPELDPTYGIQAIATWQELLTRYPESGAAATGRERIAGLNNWFAIKEFKNGKFYLRYKAYDSAILVFKDLIAKYPRTSVAPEALSELVGAYRRLGYVEDVEEMCGYFRTNYSDSPLLGESCPNPAAAPPAGTPPGD
jgi:outer membrane protein assembly factor BamD